MKLEFLKIPEDVTRRWRHFVANGWSDRAQSRRRRKIEWGEAELEQAGIGRWAFDLSLCKFGSRDCRGPLKS